MIPLQCGKKPAAPYQEALGFKTHFGAAVSAPLVIEPPDVAEWRVLANNFASDCVQAGAAHEVMTWAACAKKPIPLFTPTPILADYRAINPDDKDMTGGTSALAYAQYRQRNGILDSSGVRHKIDLFAQIEPGNTEELGSVVQRFKCAGVGVSLPADAQLQFFYQEPWTVHVGGALPGRAGHYIVCVGRNTLGQWLFVTWGRLQAASDEWVRTYMDEGYAYFQREMLDPSEDVAALEQAIRDLS